MSNNNRDNRDLLHREKFEQNFDKNVKREQEMREARENAEAMKQTLTWLIPLLLLLAIGYYLYKRAYTPTAIPVKPVATAVQEAAVEAVKAETKPETK